MFLFFDTETTGIPLNGVDISDPRQPRIVQLAAELVSDEGEVLRSISAIIKPDGWSSIPEGAQKAHGISFERCMDEGRCMKEVLAEFNEMKASAHSRAAYNISFDKRLLIREAKFHGVDHDSSKFDESSYCVMKMITPIVKMAPTQKMLAAGYKKNKSPKLIEAYEYCFGKPFEGAHDAMNDVRACREVFFFIRDNHADHFKPEEKKEYNPELALKPAPDETGRQEDAALCGTLF